MGVAPHPGEFLILQAVFLQRGGRHHADLLRQERVLIDCLQIDLLSGTAEFFPNLPGGNRPEKESGDEQQGKQDVDGL